jgi:hypothetical protein
MAFVGNAISGVGRAVSGIFGGGGGGGGSAPAPAAPDYTAAAKATAQGNLEAARAALAGSLIGQETPYGSLSYREVGTDRFGNPMYTATQSLSPAQQELLNYDLATSRGLGQLSAQGLNYVRGMMENPFSTRGLPTLASQVDPNLVGMQGWDRATNLLMQRLQPQMQRREQQLEQQLANQGISRGSEAYTRAKQDLAMQQNDLLNQAALSGASLQGQFFGQGVTGANLANQARQQGFGELAYMRNEPLNTLNAVRSGAQVTQPQFVNTPVQAPTAGADYLAATNALYANQMSGYNAQQAAQANQQSGMMGLLGSLGGAALLKYSDPRTKENIKAIGIMENGLTLYSFEYKDEFKEKGYAGHGVHVGVMADEVEQVYPYAVRTLDDGYKVVDYGLIP